MIEAAFIGIWLNTGIAYEFENPRPPPRTTWVYDSNQVENPIGHVSLGATWEIRGPLPDPIQIEAGAQHDSMMLVNDLGRNQVFVRFKVWLWKR